MWFSRMLKVAGDKAEDYRSMHDIRYRVMGRYRWANRGSLASCALRTMRGGSSNTAQLIPDPGRPRTRLGPQARRDIEISRGPRQNDHPIHRSGS